jgi:hypothetical protein
MSGRVPDGTIVNVYAARFAAFSRGPTVRLRLLSSVLFLVTAQSINLHWDDAAHALAVAERQGKFPGMSASHTFRIVVVGKDHGVGVESFATSEKILEYSGAALAAKF